MDLKPEAQLVCSMITTLFLINDLIVDKNNGPLGCAMSLKNHSNAMHDDVGF